MVAFTYFARSKQLTEVRSRTEAHTDNEKMRSRFCSTISFIVKQRLRNSNMSEVHTSVCCSNLIKVIFIYYIDFAIIIRKFAMLSKLTRAMNNSNKNHIQLLHGLCNNYSKMDNVVKAHTGHELL